MATKLLTGDSISMDGFRASLAGEPSIDPDCLMDLYEPFFRQAAQGVYSLATGNEELRQASLEALQILFPDQEVNRVVMVSLAHPATYPGMLYTSYLTHRPDNLYSRLTCDGPQVERKYDSSEERWDEIFDRLWTSLEVNLNNSLLDSLWEGLQESKWGKLWIVTSDRARFRSHFAHLYLRDILNSHEAILFQYLFYTFVDRPKAVQKLESMVRLLPKAIPLGRKYKDDKVWLVLVA